MDEDGFYDQDKAKRLTAERYRPKPMAPGGNAAIKAAGTVLGIIIVWALVVLALAGAVALTRWAWGVITGG
jgi:hypothetical protein